MKVHAFCKSGCELVAFLDENADNAGNRGQKAPTFRPCPEFIRVLTCRAAQHRFPIMPIYIHSEVELEDSLSTPSAEDVAFFRDLEGDLLIIGVAGKMGPSLARRAARASQTAGVPRRIIGASRFSMPSTERLLQEIGVKTLRTDLLDSGAVSALPDAANIIFMAGRKFGSTGAESLTWAMNAYLPALIAERFRHSRIVVFFERQYLSPGGRGFRRRHGGNGPRAHRRIRAVGAGAGTHLRALFPPRRNSGHPAAAELRHRSSVRRPA